MSYQKLGRLIGFKGCFSRKCVGEAQKQSCKHIQPSGKMWSNKKIELKVNKIKKMNIS
jgi:hypothetical protein